MPLNEKILFLFLSAAEITNLTPFYLLHSVCPSLYTNTQDVANGKALKKVKKQAPGSLNPTLSGPPPSPRCPIVAREFLCLD